MIPSSFGHALRAKGIADAAIRAAVAAFGRLDVLVNNAGYANANAIEDLPNGEAVEGFSGVLEKEVGPL